MLTVLLNRQTSTGYWKTCADYKFKIQIIWEQLRRKRKEEDSQRPWRQNCECCGWTKQDIDFYLATIATIRSWLSFDFAVHGVLEKWKICLWKSLKKVLEFSVLLSNWFNFVEPIPTLIDDIPVNFCDSSGTALKQRKMFGLTVNADALTANGQFREEFQAGAYLVDGGSNSPYKLVCYKSS